MLISAVLQPSGRITEVRSAIPADGMLGLSDETFAAPPVRLMRRKFNAYANRAEFRQGFVSDLAATAEWATITGVIHGCRDPDEDIFSRLQSTARPAVL